MGRNIVTGTHSTHNYGLQFDERLFREHLDEIQKQASRLDDMVRENPTNDQQDLQEKPEASTSTQVEHLNKEGGSILPPSNETPASLTHRIVENSRPNEVNSKVYKGNGVRKRGDLESRRRKRVSRVRNMFRLTNSSSEEDFSPDEDATVLKRVYTHHKSRNVAVRRFKMHLQKPAMRIIVKLKNSTQATPVKIIAKSKNAILVALIKIMNKSRDVTLQTLMLH